MKPKNATAALSFGFFLFMTAFPLLFWNEGRAVKTARALAEGARNVISVKADTVDSRHEAALIHVSAHTLSKETLTDNALGISVNAIKLRRIVEMFQWQKRHGENEGQTYYEKVWSEKLIPSAEFDMPGHDNPDSMPLESTTWSAQEVTLGAFWLSPGLIEQLKRFEPLNLPPSELTSYAERLGLARAELDGASLFLPYAGGNLSRPKIGDLRLRLEQVLDGPVSAIAQQEGSSLTAYETRSGRKLELLREGSLSAEEMFEAAVSENNALTWGLRIFGFLLMVFGIHLLLRPLISFTRFIPLLSGLMRMGVSIVSVVLAFSLSLLSASLAWFSYRPFIALPLLLLAIAAFFVIQRIAKGKERRLA